MIRGGAAGQIVTFSTFDGSPFPAEAAFCGSYDLLVDANGTVFPNNVQTINLRIEVSDRFFHLRGHRSSHFYTYSGQGTMGGVHR